MRFCFVTLSLELRTFQRYSLDGDIPNASTAFPLQRRRSILSEASTQYRQSTTASSSQTNTPPNAHADSSARGSPPHHVHHAGWKENLRDLSKLHWINRAGSPPIAHHDATESEGVHEKGYNSTDTEVEAKRDVNPWKRERRKRRRKAEIYVKFSDPSHYTTLTRASHRLLDTYRLLSPGRRSF